MGKRFASFYRCLAFARFWKVKFWRSFIKCQYFNDGWTDFHKKNHTFILGFFRNRKTRVSHPVKMMTRWPGHPDVENDPNDPLTRWPSDRVPCLWRACPMNARRDRGVTKASRTVQFCSVRPLWTRRKTQFLDTTFRRWVCIRTKKLSYRRGTARCVVSIEIL